MVALRSAGLPSLLYAVSNPLAYESPAPMKDMLTLDAVDVSYSIEKLYL
jgi:hypothetical protein